MGRSKDSWDKEKKQSAKEKKRRLKRERKKQEVKQRQAEKEKREKQRKLRMFAWPLKKLRKFWKDTTKEYEGTRFEKDSQERAKYELSFVKERLAKEKLDKIRARLKGKELKEFTRYKKYLTKLKRQLAKKKQGNGRKIKDRTIEKIIRTEDEVVRVQKILYGDLMRVG